MKKMFKKKITTSLILASSFIITTSSFAAQLKPTHKEDKWGFMDETGKQVVALKYDGVSNFKDGYAPVLKNNLWGFIDESGKEVVAPMYTGVSNFRDGYAPSIKGSKWGILNTTGQEVIPFIYDELYYFDNHGKAYAKKDGKWGKINKEEKVIVPFVHDKLDFETKTVSSNSKVIVDGKEVSFDAYTINDNNYFKLRDIAKVLDGSKKQFEVSWNEATRSIDLIPNKSYTTIGGELEKSIGDTKTLRFNEAIITKQGSVLDLLAYNISGNTYFKLRDVARAFNVGVNWNEKSKTIELNTLENYTE